MSWMSRLLVPAEPVTLEQERARRYQGIRSVFGGQRMSPGQTAATIISGQDGRTPVPSMLPTTLSWQDECWGFYDSLGMYRNAVTWKSDMLGRVRLRAARKDPQNDEPTVLDKGPAAEIVAELQQDVQSQIMSGLAVYLTVPGEGFLIGETVDGVNNWSARSADEVRWRPSSASRQNTASPYEVIDENTPGSTGKWRRLAAQSFAVRVWRPHRRYYNMADSSSKAARGTMRELEMVNRTIVSQYMSRLAMAGLIVFPTQVDFPVRKEFQDMPDAFIREWIERASEALRTPGSASSCVPLPIQVDERYVDKIHLIEFGTTRREMQIIQRRDSAIKQLAVDLDTPPETLTGLGEANHWSGWLIEEAGFKIYLAPDTELIVGALTKGYLRPRLAAAGEEATNLVVWYDESEITQRPDKSANTLAAYKMGEASGKALRREIGLNEDDAPKADDLAKMVLWTLANNPLSASQALRDLTGHILGQGLVGTKQTITVPTAAPGPTGQAVGQGEHLGPPEQPNSPPEQTPGQRLAAIEAGLAAAGRLDHAMQVAHSGLRVYHPDGCPTDLRLCPIESTVDTLLSFPGTSGTYHLSLTDEGMSTLGQRLYDADVHTMRPGEWHSKIRLVTMARPS